MYYYHQNFTLSFIYLFSFSLSTHILKRTHEELETHQRRGHSSEKSTDQSMAASKMAREIQLGIRRLSAQSSGGVPGLTVTAKIDYSVYQTGVELSRNAPLPHHLCRRDLQQRREMTSPVSSLDQGHFCFHIIKCQEFLHKSQLQETLLWCASCLQHRRWMCSILQRISSRDQRKTSSIFHWIR